MDYERLPKSWFKSGCASTNGISHNFNFSYLKLAHDWLRMALNPAR